jgi:hypothetical protein
MVGIMPRLFIGSSGEAYEVVLRFRNALKDVAEIVPWREAPEWRTMWSTLDGLLDVADGYDFGLFIFAADDDVVSRNRRQKAVRDNVLLELGLFLGRIGRDRTFAVLQEAVAKAGAVKVRRDEKLKGPSDLLGIHLPRFKREGPDSQKSIQEAAAQIRRLILQEGRRRVRVDLVSGWHYRMDTQTYSVTIPTLRLKRRENRLKGKRLLLVCRVENKTVVAEDDLAIAMSALVPVPTLIDQEIVIAVRDMRLFRSVRDGDIIEGHLLVVPEGVRTTAARTLTELVARGCDLVDSKAATARLRP